MSQRSSYNKDIFNVKEVTTNTDNSAKGKLKLKGGDEAIPRQKSYHQQDHSHKDYLRMHLNRSGLRGETEEELMETNIKAKKIPMRIWKEKFY